MLGSLKKRVDLKAAVISGLAAGAVYVATMEIDNRITKVQADDLKFLGRPFVKNPDKAKLAGIPVHINNSIGLAVAYAALGHDRIPGPPWLRGVIFASVENTVLYPLTILENLHPGIREGQIDRYWSFRAYLQSVPRHVTYGAVVGTVYAALRKR
jgi:hypothetical protein